MSKIIPLSFFEDPVVDVAQNLLGKYLVRNLDGKSIAFMINEVEAYDGPHDLASHGRFGKTARTAVMFGPAGHFYVYLIYGMYWMLNIVTGPEGYAAGVLIRGVGHLHGPGKLTKFLHIDGKLNALPVAPASHLWIEDRGEIITPTQIVVTPRIGIEYAGPWAHKPLRFVLKQ